MKSLPMSTPPMKSNKRAGCVELQSIIHEIEDLESYINGLPNSLKNSPYGEVYKQRLKFLISEKNEIEDSYADDINNCIKIAQDNNAKT